MFSGIGGFELGIQNAYVDLSNTKRVQQGGATRDSTNNEQELMGEEQPTCIGFSEIDKYAIQIYEQHFKHKNYGNATTIIASELSDFDLLVGGFPCQAFSIAGKRGGFNDTRGTLFFDIARILKEKRPQHCLLENVKGLLSHDNGRTFKTILTTLVELGYDVEWQVLNSKNFGVPQNRERVFIVGHLGRCCGRKVFPFSSSNGTDNEQNISTALDANYWKGIDNHGQRTHIGTLRTHKDGEGFRESKSGLSPTIPARAREDGSGQPVVAVPLKFLERNQKNFQGKYSFTVDTLNTGGVLKGMRVRRLTPTECERLQSYPDGWTKEVSDTQRYKTLGNSVTVNVIEELIKKLYEP